MIARGIDVENCGCVSLAKDTAAAAWPPAWTKGVGWFLVTRNLVLLAAAMAFVLGQRPGGLPSEGRSTAAPPGPPEAGA